MRRRPPRSTRNEPLFPNATLSRSPGQGTRFSVALPLPVAQAPVATPARGATGGGTITGPLQLLLVEDDPTVAEVVTGLLRAQGHAVVHAAHGLAALSEAAARSFDLALLDLEDRKSTRLNSSHQCAFRLPSSA